MIRTFNPARAFYGRESTNMTWNVYYFQDGVLYRFIDAPAKKFNEITARRKPTGMISKGHPIQIVAEHGWTEVFQDELENLMLYGWETKSRDELSEEDVKRSYGMVLARRSEDAQALMPTQPQEFTLELPPESFQHPEPVAKLPAGVWLSEGPGLPAKHLIAQSGLYSVCFTDHGKRCDVQFYDGTQDVLKASEDPLASEIKAYPAYWRPLPAHFKALDFYRVRALFPLPEGYESARLDHALKKLLIPGNRTGGKSVYKDLKEAHATLGQWLREHKDAFDQ